MTINSREAVAPWSRPRVAGDRFGYTQSQIVAMRRGFLAAFIGGVVSGVVLAAIAFITIVVVL